MNTPGEDVQIVRTDACTLGEACRTEQVVAVLASDEEVEVAGEHRFSLTRELNNHLKIIDGVVTSQVELLVMRKRQQAPGELEQVREFVNTLDVLPGSEELTDPGALARWLSDHGLGSSQR